MHKLTTRVRPSDQNHRAPRAGCAAEQATQLLTTSARNCGATITLAVILASFALPAHATNSVFDVLYFGNNVATLAPGSDDPDATMLVPSDTFQWSIAAQNGGFWEVVTGGDFYPLMAFTADPQGVRTADFDLQLLNNGAEVFSLSEAGIENEYVHVGTNTVTLDTGLIFDEMRLNYLLIEALEKPDDAADPENLLPVDTSLFGYLPIFGAPENNEHSLGITYSVPEPSTLALGLLSGLALIASARARFRGK